MKKIFGFLILIVLLIITKFLISSEEQISMLEKDNLLMIAHRGASLHAPEHTLESYRLANEKDADYIEIDLRLTSDDILVAIHDKSVDRTTNGTGKVSDLSLDEIKQLDAGRWFNDSFKGSSVPTLEEILQEFNSNVNYYIETKTTKKDLKMEVLLLEMLEDYSLLENASSGNVVIQSFSEESLKFISDSNDEIPLILLKRYDSEASITDDEIEEIAMYAIGLGVNHESLTKEFIEKVASYGMIIHSYTVNESSEIKRLELMGVDGVFTDNIDVYEQ